MVSPNRQSHIVATLKESGYGKYRNIMPQRASAAPRTAHTDGPRAHKGEDVS